MYGCTDEREPHTILAPLTQVYGNLYHVSSASNLYELPEGFEEIGSIQKEIPMDERPFEDFVSNRYSEGSNVYMHTSSQARIYIKRDDIFVPMDILHPALSPMIHVDGNLYVNSSDSNLAELPAEYKEIGTIEEIIPIYQRPLSDFVTNSDAYPVGSRIYMHARSADRIYRIYVQIDNIYIPFDILIE